MFKKVQAILISSTFALINAQTGGQNFTSSPYSNFGLGEQLSSQFLQIGMGHATRSTAYSYSTFNPATLGNIQYTTMDFGISARTGTIEAGGQKSSFNGGGFNHLGLAFKVYHKDFYKVVLDSFQKAKRKDYLKLKINAFANVRPLTSVGYNYSIQKTLPIQSTIAHSGKGGVNLAEFGLGFKFNNWVSLGYSGGYVFGGLSDASIFSVKDSLDYQLISDISNRNIRGMKHNFGFLKQFGNDSNSHSFGFNYGLYSGVFNNNQRVTTSIVVDNFGRTYVSDTVINDNNGYHKGKLPVYFGIGYSYQWHDKVLVQLNYAQQNWKSIGVNNQYSNRKEYGIGIILNPNDEKPKNAKRMPVQIRAGYRFVNTENNVTSNNVVQNITESQAYIGFGIPMVRRYFDNTQIRSLVNVDFGFMQRGTLNNNLAKEQYFTARVGFNLGDIWFQRKKFN